MEILRRQLREKFPEACGAWRGGEGRQEALQAAACFEESGAPALVVGEPPASFGTGGAAAWEKRGDTGPAVLEFPAGMLTEVSGVGAGWVIAALLDPLTEEPGAPEMVLVDGADGFDPASFSGRVCARLLWVRCRKSATEMIKAADWVVRDGNVPLVLMDATGLDRRELTGVPATAWWRLKLGAERAGCRLVVVAAASLVPAAGHRLHLSARVGLDDFAASREELFTRLQLQPQRLRQVK